MNHAIIIEHILSTFIIQKNLETTSEYKKILDDDMLVRCGNRMDQYYANKSYIKTQSFMPELSADWFLSVCFERSPNSPDHSIVYCFPCSGAFKIKKDIIWFSADDGTNHEVTNDEDMFHLSLTYNITRTNIEFLRMIQKYNNLYQISVDDRAFYEPLSDFRYP